MTGRAALAALLAAALATTGAALARCGAAPRAELVHRPGFEEPHTPGAPGAPPASAALRTVAGEAPELNRVSTLRVSLARPGQAPPRAVLILVPGFLGGAATFAPLARQLVQAMAGTLEVWAVDRRPNQLEDTLGVRHAAEGLARGDAQAATRGAQFYFPDTDRAPTGNFPGPEDLDVDPGDGGLRGRRPLEDAEGRLRTAVTLSQDDLRFGAHWGVDTYARDWRRLVEEARARVGPRGLVLFGGHSMGTTWASVFAAYDFDPHPGRVDAAFDAIDGLLLLEGGGAGPPDADAPDLAAYRSRVDALAAEGGPDVYLESFSGVEIAAGLGPAAGLAGVAALAAPDAPALGQRIPIFGSGVLGLFFQTPASNRGLLGLFIDDDFQPVTAFRASVGFSDDGPNQLGGPAPAVGLPDVFYVAGPAPDGLRSWRGIDDPALPSCEGADPAVSPGCADFDHGPRPPPDAPPALWGREVEVTELETLARTQFEGGNFVEWYFLSGRVDLDLRFGRDAGALAAESVAAEGHEGPLAVTQNARVDVPVLAIGGSNGLAPTEAAFADYLGSIATPPEEREVVILEGYAHLDVLTARDNAAVPPVAGWVSRLLQRKLLGRL